MLSATGAIRVPWAGTGGETGNAGRLGSAIFAIVVSHVFLIWILDFDGNCGKPFAVSQGGLRFSRELKFANSGSFSGSIRLPVPFFVWRQHSRSEP